MPETPGFTRSATAQTAAFAPRTKPRRSGIVARLDLHGALCPELVRGARRRRSRNPVPPEPPAPVRRSAESDSRTPSHQGYRPDSRGKYTVTPRGPEPSGRSAARAASSAWCTSPAPRRATSRAIRAPGRAASDTPRTPGPADRRPQRYVTDGDGRFGFGRFLRRRRAGWTDDPRACGERRRGHC